MGKRRHLFYGFGTVLCCFLIALAALFAGEAQAAGVWESREKPVLVVTGAQIVAQPSSTDEAALDAVIGSLAAEKAYTLDELRALPQVERVYSSLNSGGFRKQHRVSGVDLAALLALSGFDISTHPDADITFKSGPSYQRLVEDFSSVPRYSYPQQAAGSQSGRVAIDATITLRSIVGADNSDAAPTSAALADQQLPSLTVGATGFQDMNQSGFVKELDTIQVGDAVTANTVNIFGTAYTRAQLLGMERVTATYTYITKKGEFTDTVRGVALADMVGERQDAEIVSVTFADGYTPLELTVAELREETNRYMLALEEKVDGKWQPIYSIKGGFSGMGKLYHGKAGETVSGGPASMIAGIGGAGDDFSASPFKHVTYVGTSDGAIYAPDAITGATLTVEGPGMAGTTPIMVGDLERTDNDNIYRGEYTDKRDGKDTTLLYEGVTVQSILEGKVNALVERTSDDLVIVFKNRWRQDVCAIPYQDIIHAKTPVIMAYGTGLVDESVVAPFVYDKEPGLLDALGNDDGGLKLVFDSADFPGLTLPQQFSSVAYIYAEFGGDAPGYKHTKAADEAYSNVENTEYLVTLVGSALGREVNLTVAELENMVRYGRNGEPTGIGYRDAYSLSNTTYWYVNTYEGVKLWDLLVKLGLPAAQYRDDKETLVTFTSWDNYKTTASFTMQQLANPDLFYFYEKSPADIGTDRPTKEELALTENQPDNQVGVWTRDSNGYPVQAGYPVLLAYGVNGYPYVRNASMEGYYGGLGNDGGPLRVIFGKADNMNRNNPEDIANYAYFFNNGSNQMQRVQEIIVGDEVRYSTHSENPDPAYQAMKDETALTVEVVQTSGASESKSFTLAELEDLIYGVEKRDRDNDGRQEKGYYVYQKGKDALFEGVNLWYLLSEAVGMQGSLGTVSFYSGETCSASVSLDSLKQSGGNSLRGTSDLAAMLAFAKNGYPLVADAKSDGYLKKDEKTGVAVDNQGGPLMFVRPLSSAEQESSRLPADLTAAGVTRIVVQLEADQYAHTGAYAAAGAARVAFDGAVSRAASMQVSDIEKLQKYMVTDTYTVNGKNVRYRGVDLQLLLNDAAVGASALLDKVTVRNAAGAAVDISVSDLASGVNGKRIILAYGIGKAGGESKDGRPLVPAVTDSGYDAAYGNSGGPLMLVIDGRATLGQVTQISVAAAEVTGWTHTYGYYQDYLDMPVLRVTGSGVKTPVTFTVGQLESMRNEMVTDEYKMANQFWFQGVDLYKLLMNHVELTDASTAPNFTAYAKDAYATTFKGSDLANGVNGKPILIAYGQGVSQSDGLPLVDGDDGSAAVDGFDANYGNAFGPVRLIVNDNTGWCVKWLRCIVIGTGSYQDPAEYADDIADIPVTVSGNAAK